jgi:hypothetical protein
VLDRTMPLSKSFLIPTGIPWTYRVHPSGRHNIARSIAHGSSMNVVHKLG